MIGQLTDKQVRVQVTPVPSLFHNKLSRNHGTRSLVFIDDGTDSRISSMNSGAYSTMLFAQTLQTAGKQMLLQEHTANARVSQSNEMGYSSMYESPDLNPTEHTVQLLKIKLKVERPTNKKDLQWLSEDPAEHSREQTKHFPKPTSSRKVCKGFSFKH